MTIPESLGNEAKENNAADPETVPVPVAPAAIKKEEVSEREKHHVKMVAQLRSDFDILHKKLFLERGTTDKLKKEIEQLKASESTVRYNLCLIISRKINLGLLMVHDIAVEARRGPAEADA